MPVRKRLRHAVCMLVVLGAAIAAPVDRSSAVVRAQSNIPAPVSAEGCLPETFCSRIEPLDATTQQRMTGVSWHPGCPVALRDLRRVVASHYTFTGTVGSGELIVHKDVAAAVQRVLRRLFDARFQIDRMRPIDEYQGDDDLSTMANNSSAFNCRRATGGTSFSQHAFGRAIDLNPVQNPYVRRDGSVLDPAAVPYRNRAKVATLPGVITSKGVVTRAFTAEGWGWGGAWKTIKDYQHFSATGR